MTKSYRQNLKAFAPCLTFTCKDSFPSAAGLAQSVRALDCRAGVPGFDSRARSNTQGLKITEENEGTPFALQMAECTFA